MYANFTSKDFSKFDCHHFIVCCFFLKKTGSIPEITFTKSINCLFYATLRFLVHRVGKQFANKQNEMWTIYSRKWPTSHLTFFWSKRRKNWIPNQWHIYLRNVLVHEAWNTVFAAMNYAVVLHTVNMWNKDHVVYKHLLNFLGKKECIIFITRKRQQRKSMPPINFRDWNKLSPTTIQVKAYGCFQVTLQIPRRC